MEGLNKVREEMAAGEGGFDPGIEDIHMAVESRLVELIGPLGGKLHTGRSRNDQVNVDERLYLREAIAAVRLRVRRLQQVLVAAAEAHMDVVLPWLYPLAAGPAHFVEPLRPVAVLDARTRRRASPGYL